MTSKIGKEGPQGNNDEDGWDLEVLRNGNSGASYQGKAVELFEQALKKVNDNESGSDDGDGLGTNNLNKFNPLPED